MLITHGKVMCMKDYYDIVSNIISNDRFKELKNNVFYAEMSPKNNVIFLLAEHFKKRLWSWSNGS